MKQKYGGKETLVLQLINGVMLPPCMLLYFILVYLFIILVYFILVYLFVHIVNPC